MSSLQDLKGVIKETLEHRGVLNQVKARIRSEVFSALDDQADEKPPPSNENVLINELIREYLEFNKYKYTASVLQAESGQRSQHLDREFLVKELNIIDDKSTETIPLLYGIVAHFLNHNKHSNTSEGRHDKSGVSPFDNPGNGCIFTDIQTIKKGVKHYFPG